MKDHRLSWDERHPGIEWPAVDWVRSLFLTRGASGEWHAPRIKSYATVTYCELTIQGPLETASEGKAEREGRCVTCVTRLMPPTALAAEPKKAPTPRRIARPAPKKKSSEGSARKRSARRSR
jgi:hypothetical protein